MTELTGPLAGGFLSLTSTDTWVLVAFILFGLLLNQVGAFAFIGRLLDQRGDGIRKQLDEARKLREEAQGRLARVERRHQEVEREAAAIVERAKADAERAAAEATSSIEASVAQRVANAQDQIRVAEETAVRTVREAAIDAAIAASADVLRGSVSGSGAGDVLDRAIDEVRAAATH